MFDGVSGADGVPSASRFTVFTSETISKEDSYSIFAACDSANFLRSPRACSISGSLKSGICSSLTATFGCIASMRARCSSAILVGEYFSVFLPAFVRRDRPVVGITSSSSSSFFSLFLLPRASEAGVSSSSLSKSDHFSSSCTPSSSESSSSNSISSITSSSSSDSK